MRALRRLGRDWLPPALLRGLRMLRGQRLRFTTGYAGWQEAAADSPGYADPQIVARVLDSTLRVQRGEAAACRDGVCLDTPEYAWPVVAGLLGAAARRGGSLVVLDYGGALGGSFLQYRPLLQGLSRLRWIVVEQPHFVECGRRHLSIEGLDFAHTLEEALALARPDAILLSSVLQYLEHPRGLLRSLGSAGADTLVIDRTPFSEAGADRVVVQHAPRLVSRDAYPCWVFSEASLLEELARSWILRARFDCPEGEMRLRGGPGFAFRGLLLDSAP